MKEQQTVVLVDDVITVVMVVMRIMIVFHCMLVVLTLVNTTSMSWICTSGHKMSH